VRGYVLCAAGISAGALAAGLYGAYQSFQWFNQEMRDAKIRAATGRKIEPVFGQGANGSIDQFRAALDNQLTSDEALNILVQIDATSALADMDRLGAVAEAVQEHADTYDGLNWKESLTEVLGAIENNNGALIEQMGLIRDARDVLQDYADTAGKLPQQLSPAEQQDALIDAVITQNAQLVESQDSATESLIESEDRIKVAFSNFMLALLAPEHSEMAMFWAEILDKVTAALKGLASSLRSG
jgi:hypothetical protein